MFPCLRCFVLFLFLTFSQPEITTLHGGQSRSWSAEQREENKRVSLAAPPRPPTHPHAARKKNNTHTHMARPTKRNKSKDGQRGHHVTHLHACLGATQVLVRVAPVQASFDPSIRQISVTSQVLTFPVSLPISSLGEV